MHMSEDIFSQCFLWIRGVAWGQCELVVWERGGWLVYQIRSDNSV